MANANVNVAPHRRQQNSETKGKRHQVPSAVLIPEAHVSPQCQQNQKCNWSLHRQCHWKVIPPARHPKFAQQKASMPETVMAQGTSDAIQKFGSGLGEGLMFVNGSLPRAEGKPIAGPDQRMRNRAGKR